MGLLGGKIHQKTTEYFLSLSQSSVALYGENKPIKLYRPVLQKKKDHANSTLAFCGSTLKVIFDLFIFTNHPAPHSTARISCTVARKATSPFRVTLLMNSWPYEFVLYRSGDLWSGIVTASLKLEPKSNVLQMAT